MKSKASVSESGRKQFLFLDLQCPRQKDHFRILHAAELRLDFGNRVFSDVPANIRTTRRQHGLRPALAIADSPHDRTDNVLRNGFAHDFALTVCEWGLVFLPISEGMSHEGNAPAIHRRARNGGRETFHHQAASTALAFLQTGGMMKFF
jgi:hypothetical protein